MTIFALCVLSVSSWPLWPSDVTYAQERDCSWWRQFSFPIKVTFLTGYLAHAHSGRSSMLFAFGRFTATDKDQCFQVVMRLQDAMQAEAELLESVSPEQYARGLDELCKDFRNGPLPVLSLLSVVRESIQGATKAEIEETLVILRKTWRDMEDALEKVPAGR